VKISLCLLVWNELEGCRLDIPKISRNLFDEIYAVDGGSTDGTVTYLESEGIPVYRQPKKSLNAAYIHAVERSACDAVVVFFPKGNLPTADLQRFRPLLERGYDLVIASRNIKGAGNEEDVHWLKPRKWAGMSLAAVSALVWRREGYFVRDVLHGVKGFTVSAFKKMGPLDYGLSIDVEMVIRAYRLRLKRVEFPTTELPRLHGQTHFRFFSMGFQLARYLWQELHRGV
jgi:glycosyltransferase involved in cell wall biosynthesis